MPLYLIYMHGSKLKINTIYIFVNYLCFESKDSVENKQQPQQFDNVTLLLFIIGNRNVDSSPLGFGKDWGCRIIHWILCVQDVLSIIYEIM